MMVLPSITRRRSTPSTVKHQVRVSSPSVPDQSTQWRPATTDSPPRFSDVPFTGAIGIRGDPSNFRYVRFAELRSVNSLLLRSKTVLDLSGPSTRWRRALADQRRLSTIGGWPTLVTS